MTDPPFYDNVMYSELSDFFYAWIQNPLKDTGKFTNTRIDSSKEIIKNHVKDRNFYKESLKKVYSECNRVLRKDGLMTFTFHHSNPDAWKCIEEAILQSNFKVIDAIPVFSEMDTSTSILNKSAGVIDVILVCAKRESTYPSISRDYSKIIKSFKQEFGLKETDINSIKISANLVGV